MIDQHTFEQVVHTFR